MSAFAGHGRAMQIDDDAFFMRMVVAAVMKLYKSDSKSTMNKATSMMITIEKMTATGKAVMVIVTVVRVMVVVVMLVVSGQR